MTRLYVHQFVTFNTVEVARRNLETITSGGLAR